jgi:serine/threonine-protein kinase
MIEFRTLGAVDLRGAAGQELRGVLAQPKRLALLAYLALATPRGFQRRDVLLALFWPESDNKRARAALRKAVHVLRRELGKGVLVSRGDEEVGLADGTVWCDVVAFEHALREQRSPDALELYRGDLLDGFFVSGAPVFERWVDGERARLREHAAAGAWALAEQAAAEERDDLAVKWIRRAMNFTPEDEGALRRLITLFYQMGDRAAALHEYNQFAARLLQEYGVRPSAETRQLIDLVKASGEMPRSASGKRLPAPPSTPRG